LLEWIEQLEAHPSEVLNKVAMGFSILELIATLSWSWRLINWLAGSEIEPTRFVDRECDT